MPVNTDLQVRAVADYQCVCGENPLWHPTEKKLYWTDNVKGRLFRYDPANDASEQVYEDRPVGGFTFEADGALLLFRDRGNVVRWRDGRVLETIVDEIPDEVTTRFNDVMADGEGRVYCGTMPTKDRPGRLYRLDRDGSYRILLEGIGCANGMGFTLDGKTLYFTDSEARTIWQFDYDRATGELANQRPAVRTPEGEGVPDGMCVDSQGHLWSARWGGSGVYQYDAAGELLGKIDVPAQRVSCVMFGGDDLKDMYLTTAGGENKTKFGPGAGALFHVRPGIQGRPEYFSRLGKS